MSTPTINLNEPLKVLICDLIGLKFDHKGEPDFSEVRAHIEKCGGAFHIGSQSAADDLELGKIHFFYQPHLSTKAELLEETKQGQYDGVIAAATTIPEESIFGLGGVRIGAGTGNMLSASWGGRDGIGGTAVLMNTPGINSRATAQMVIRAIMQAKPDLPLETLHRRVLQRLFDTGRDLREFPTVKLEGQRLTVFGYGNIGREVARLGKAFRMIVTVYAKERHRRWIEAEGFIFQDDAIAAATGADVLSVHIGLGKFEAESGCYSNQGFIGRQIFEVIERNAILINFDRGELVDPDALADALSCERIALAAIDADIFVADGKQVSGPLLPYLALADRYPDKLLLLPHAAADTDHPTRVAGAKQAVDQIMALINNRTIINHKGSLPEGNWLIAKRSVPGISEIGTEELISILDEDTVSGLSENISTVTSFLCNYRESAERDEFIKYNGQDLVLALNFITTLVEKTGLHGPFLK